MRWHMTMDSISGGDDPKSSAERMLLEHLAVIERIIAFVGRRARLDVHEVEEFGAFTKWRLIENDYAIIRRFEGRSRFTTFLVGAIERLYRDYRTHESGKWHASAAAERLGPIAVATERLLYRDGMAHHEALLALRQQYPDVSQETFDELIARLRHRTMRRKVSLDEALLPPAQPDKAPERFDTAARISEVVREVIEELPEEEQLLIRLRFYAQMTVAQIARSLQIDQVTLYRRLYRCFGTLRVRLQSAGVNSADVDDLVGTDTILDFHLDTHRGAPVKA
jgi:RNA polymerase sigma factor (sigma-70 family)